MSVQKFVLAGLAAAGFLVFVNVLLSPLVFPDGGPDLYKNTRPDPDRTFSLIGLLVTTFLMSYIYPMGYRGNKPWVEGLRFGMMMGAFVSVPVAFQVYAVADVSMAKQLTPVLWTVVTWGFAGSLIGLVYGRRED